MTSNINLNSFSSESGILFNRTNSYSSIVAVSGNLDINGDGFSDALLLTTSGDSSARGTVYAIAGSKNPSSFYNVNELTPPNFKVYNSASAPFFCSVSSVGDVNKDGFDDFIIGSYNSGNVFLVLGNGSLPSSISVSNSQYVTSIFGFNNPKCPSLGGGDFNKDGYSDIVICSPSGSNACYIYFGSANIPTQINLSVMGSKGVTITGSYSTGTSVSSAGDVNNDGISDLLIATEYCTSYCASYLVWGSASFPTTINLNNLGSYGVTIEGSGNVGSLNFNGDSFSDMIVGTTIIYGNSSLPSSINLENLGDGGVEITMEISGCGSSVAGVGDLNDDGFDEFAIGCPSSNEEISGNIAVFYGGNNIPSSIYIDDFNSLSAYNGYYISGDVYTIGSSVANAGNFTGSKFNSMVLAAPYYYESNTTAYLLYGSEYEVPLTTSSPSAAATIMPTKTPSLTPTIKPTALPSLAPSSQVPTSEITKSPSFAPSISPTKAPTTNSPSTIKPTTSPSLAPSKGNSTIESDSNNSDGMSAGELAGIYTGSIIGGLITIAGIGYLIYSKVGPLLMSSHHHHGETHATTEMNVMHGVDKTVADDHA